MRKAIGLTDTQISFVRQAVDHVVEFGEDVGQSGHARAGEMKTALGIANALLNPLPVGKLTAAAKSVADDLDRTVRLYDQSDGVIEIRADVLAQWSRRLRKAMEKV